MLDSNVNLNEIEAKITATTDDDCRLKPIDEENNDNLDESAQAQVQSDGEHEHRENEFSPIKYQRSKSLDPVRMLDGFDPMKKRFSSIMSLGDVVGDAIVGESYAKDGKW